MNKQLGCLSRSGIVAALLTLVLVVGFVLAFGGTLFSPGPLNDRAGDVPLGGVLSHAEIGGRCTACHVAPWSQETMNDRCVVCHSAIGEQIQGAASLHGRLFPRASAFQCRACHPEHRGQDALLTRVDPAYFPHQATGYSLQGHRQKQEGVLFTCADCHGQDLARFDPITCVSCHQKSDAVYVQAHIAAFGTDCRACHDGLDTYGPAFDHNRQAFPLLGQHTFLSCVDCHQSARSIGDLQASSQDCYACHQANDAHETSLGQDCAQCHTTEDWAGATIDHSATAFRLTGAHVSINCAQCHETQVFQNAPQDCFSCHQADDAHEDSLGQDCAQCHTTVDWAGATIDHSVTAFRLTGAHVSINCARCHETRVFQNAPQDCFSCHQADDAHQDSLGQDCAECHTTEDWAGATIDHAVTAFGLTGAHVSVDCAQCHVDKAFKGTPQDCFSCHQADDAHEDSLGQDCAECHITEDWTGATIDHSETAFPLTGAHVSVDCAQCHETKVFQNAPQDCFSCHQADDAHEASLGQNCVQCHATEDWAGATIDHSKTAFQLTGAHVSVDCAQCHESQVFQNAPQDCFSCHQADDAHQGSLGQNCVQCHTTADWAGATIDHSVTAFQLTGAHVSVDCAQCHVQVFKGTPQDCYSCHGDPAFHPGLLGINCAACHTTAAWLPAQYNLPHTFPMDHGESGWSSCRTCHPANLNAYTCYNCHEHSPGEIENEHREEGITQFQDCARCHPTGHED